MHRIKKIPPYICENVIGEETFLFQQKTYNDKRNKTILVVEPHPDDGVLSMGGYLYEQYLTGSKLISAVIFMQGGDIGIRRHCETQFVWKTLFEGDCYFLNLPDKELNLAGRSLDMYTNRQVKKIIKETCEYLLNLISDCNPDIVFFPMGIGEHSHHTLTNLCFRFIHQKNDTCCYMFYEDYPYADLGRYAYIKPLHSMYSQFQLIKEYHCINKTIRDKVNLIMAYKSQHNKQYEELKSILERYGEAIGYEGQVEGYAVLWKGIYERIWKLDF